MLDKFKTYICLLALPIPLASCQTEELYALDESCPNFSGIYHQATQICERKAPHHCKDILSSLKLSDYLGAFKYGRCPIGYRCEQTEDAPICVLREMETCQEDETRCTHGAIERCKDLTWHPQETCPLGCTEGERKATGTPVLCHACDEAQISCFETADSKWELKKCIDHQWHTARICEFGCIHDTCRECPEGSTVFENDLNGNCVHKLCDGGFYRENETFDASCNQDFTGPGECKNGAVDCLSPGILINCEKGDWVEKDIPCNPENPCAVLKGRQCIGRYIGQTCSEDGKQLVSCPGNASCTPKNTCGECQDGTERCLFNMRQICVSGEYQDHPCPEGMHCEYKNTPQCVSNICESLTRKCGDDNHVYICLFENWKPYIACEEDEECKSHGDRAWCACRPDKSRCADQENIIKCENGNWQAPTHCPNDTRCTHSGDTGECLPIEASPCDSLTYCDNDHLYTCHGMEYKASGTCLHGCLSHTECKPCQEDDKRCQDGKEQRCENGIAQIESCEYGCNAERSECNKCWPPNFQQCIDFNKFMVCKEDGTWSEPILGACP
ncbi:MAG: hypothetical protein IJ165_09420 [Proteobacteria bacterium]|nr:hypothetical protein [Pseudomonadota bacterium]